jgi:general transcription factor 3C polypeptide 5 (transcription factor C subunit 1)
MDDQDESVESGPSNYEEEEYYDDTDETDSYGSDTQEQPRVDANDEVGAPRYLVPARAMGAVEIPMVVANLDRATKAFGNVSDFKMVRPLFTSLHLGWVDN